MSRCLKDVRVQVAVTLSLAMTPVLARQAQAPPPATAAKPAEPKEDADALRIRGLVESVDAGGVTVQLSKGLSLRVDIAAGTPVFMAAPISVNDLQTGATLGVRTRAAQAAGENTRAGEVLALAGGEAGTFPDVNVRGAYKSLEKSGENAVLIVTEPGGDKRFAVTKETTFWRLQLSAVGDLKAGVSISVLVARDKTGTAGAQRAVFGSTPPGAMLPL